MLYRPCQSAFKGTKMSKISYSLTKSKITTGLRCPKKLWFDINEKIEIDHFNFHKGNVFGDKICV